MSVSASADMTAARWRVLRRGAVLMRPTLIRACLIRAGLVRADRTVLARVIVPLVMLGRQ
jgi:hypothetical protein